MFGEVAAQWSSRCAVGQGDDARAAVSRFLSEHLALLRLCFCKEIRVGQVLHLWM